MEANFFRFLGEELASSLVGRRIDKVFGPTPGIWTIKIQNTGDPLHLIYRPAKSAGHLFLSATKPANPQDAPAMAMWFRKRLRGRKILSVHTNWPRLQMALHLTPRDEPESGNYLLIDCRTGMELVDTLEHDFNHQPEWPALEDVLTEADIWREYPHISPRLRKVLNSLPEDQAHALYFGVATGSTESFYLPKTKEGWSPPLAWSSATEEETFPSALDAANAYGERTLFPMMEMEEDKPQRILVKRARKKIRRNLARLDEEKNRLDVLAQEQIKAEALQAELYRFKKAEGLEEIEVTHPVHGTMTVPLNPFLSPTENMAKYFKLAAKAQRGFPHIERRRKELLRQLQKAEDGTLEIHPAIQASQSIEQDGPSALPKRYRDLAVALFHSSDGFIILRGKNKKANHDMLSKAASPFDYWFHIQDGPSSHVILKRDHPGQDVPENTLNEAAILCGLKSYRKDDDKADVMYALVKDVRKVKGFNLGQVAVDKKIGTLRVELDPTLEDSLG
nr:NFACT RNA binding domain-containing protein [uncultured Pseudodesulfovibrio sp.]